MTKQSVIGFGLMILVSVCFVARLVSLFNLALPKF